MLRSLLLTSLALTTALLLLPPALAAQPSGVCGQPIVEFRETVVDASGTSLKAEDGGPLWQPATGIGADGTRRQLTSAHFRPTVHATLSEYNDEPQVRFEFTEEGATLMEQISARNIDRPLGIFIDGTLVTAPRVAAVIRDSGSISGISEQEAHTIAERINASLAACAAP